MAVQKPSIPKGTRDFGPAEVQKRRYILNTIEGVFRKYGFMPIETPTMENLSTLEGKYGEEGDKLLFRIMDSGEYFENFKQDFRQRPPKIYESLISFFPVILAELVKKNVAIDQKTDAEIETAIQSTNDQVIRHYFPFIEVSVIKQELIILVPLLHKLYFEFWLDHQINFKLPSNSINYVESFIVERNNSIITETLKHKLASVSSRELTKHISEKGLRYDLTVPFARYVVMNKEKIAFPFKRYQMQPVWRADRPQKGRYREFWQCDADVVGSHSLLNEIDLINIYHEAFHSLRIGYELKINNRKILAGIAETVKSVEHMSTIAVAIDKLDKIGKDGVSKELAENGFSEEETGRLFGIISLEGTTQLEQLKTLLQNSAEGLKGIEELEFILKALMKQSSNTPVQLKVDFSLARGLSYYTGCIFEVVATEGTLRSSIGGGGRYDNLTGIFGLPDVSGVGISFGLDRIYDVMEELGLFKEITVSSTRVLICGFTEEAQERGLAMLHQLREAGIASELYPDLPRSKKEQDKPMVKPMSYADALHIPYTLIIKESGLVLKDMKAKTETETTIGEVTEKLK